MKLNKLTMLLLLLASCASLVGPRELTLPLTALQRAVNQHLPFSQQYLGILQLSVEKAQLSLPTTPNHMAVAADISVAIPLLNKAWSGKMMLSGMLTLDTQQHTIQLVSPRLEQLHWYGLDQTYTAQATQIANLLIEQLFTRQPLYRFTPEDLRFAGVMFVPTKIEAKPEIQVVTVRFEPVK